LPRRHRVLAAAKQEAPREMPQQINKSEWSENEGLGPSSVDWGKKIIESKHKI
jgi:hypothetical protein